MLLAGRDVKLVKAFVAAHPLAQITRFTKRDPKQLVAEIAKVREQGWAFVDQELEEGLRVVAAPIRNPDGQTIAAVSVSTLAGTSTREAILREMLPPVLRAAAAIETDLKPVAR